MSKNIIKILLGILPNNNENIISVFDKRAEEFLDLLSKNILLNLDAKEYPDLVNFGFWCRKKNIEKIRKSLNLKYRVPKGVALHITPSNVPMNIGFSLVLGLLSGCKNIIRVPTKKFKQIEILIFLLKKILKNKKYSILRNNICLIKYERSDLISQKLSALADVRLLWGGDVTVEKFKNFKTKLKCVDLVFPNKYSAALIDFKKINFSRKMETENLVKNFYNDSFVMDQLGCSSPKIIFALNYNKNCRLFWDLLSKHVNKSYESTFSITNKKFYLLNMIAIQKRTKYLNKKNFKIVLLSSNNSKNIFSLESISNFAYGIFYLIKIKNVNNVKKYLNYKFQTLTYFGFSKSQLEKIFFSTNFNNIDRAVKIGQAFSMSEIWDGYNIIESMTKTLDIS